MASKEREVGEILNGIRKYVKNDEVLEEQYDKFSRDIRECGDIKEAREVLDSAKEILSGGLELVPAYSYQGKNTEGKYHGIFINTNGNTAQPKSSQMLPDLWCYPHYENKNASNDNEKEIVYTLPKIQVTPGNEEEKHKKIREQLDYRIKLLKHLFIDFSLQKNGQEDEFVIDKTRAIAGVRVNGIDFEVGSRQIMSQIEKYNFFDCKFYLYKKGVKSNDKSAFKEVVNDVLKSLKDFVRKYPDLFGVAKLVNYE